MYIYENPLTRKVTEALLCLVVVLAMTSYVRAVITNPGKVTRRMVIATQTTTIEHKKQYRAFYCGFCKRYIIRMDHHCGFVANCVGNFTLKFHYLLCMYTGAAGLYYDCTVAYFLVWFPERAEYISGFMWWMVTIYSLLLGILLLLPMVLCVEQTWLILSGVTTEELILNDKKDLGKYDMGWVVNLEGVFGKCCVLYWILPSTNDKTTGGDYNSIPDVVDDGEEASKKGTNPDSTEEDQYMRIAMRKYRGVRIDYECITEINKSNNG